MNKTIFTGNLGRDPEIAFRADGVAVTTFTVAANSPIQGGKESVTWYHVTCWGKLAENMYDSLEKGSRVYVEGTLKSTPEGNPDIYIYNGKPRARYEISAQFIEYQR